MKSAVSWLLLGLAVVLVCEPAVADSKKPEGFECLDSNDCKPGYCCTMSYEKFTVPFCSPIGAINEACHAGGPRPVKDEFTYPNGITVNITNTYRMYCPCQTGLDCNNDGVCKQKSP